MGRTKLTLEPHCRGSHFTWDERLRLQYPYAGSNGYRKERSPTVLGKILQKSPRAISRELEQRMVELILEEHYSPYALLERLGKE